MVDVRKLSIVYRTDYFQHSYSFGCRIVCFFVCMYSFMMNFLILVFELNCILSAVAAINLLLARIVPQLVAKYKTIAMSDVHTQTTRENSL